MAAEVLGVLWEAGAVLSRLGEMQSDRLKKVAKKKELNLESGWKQIWGKRGRFTAGAGWRVTHTRGFAVNSPGQAGCRSASSNNHVCSRNPLPVAVGGTCALYCAFLKNKRKQNLPWKPLSALILPVRHTLS